MQELYSGDIRRSELGKTASVFRCPLIDHTKIWIHLCVGWIRLCLFDTSNSRKHEGERSTNINENSERFIIFIRMPSEKSRDQQCSSWPYWQLLLMWALESLYPTRRLWPWPWLALLRSQIRAAVMGAAMESMDAWLSQHSYTVVLNFFLVFFFHVVSF